MELAPNLAGLAEVRESDIEQLRRHVGQNAAVYIKSIVPERMKIKLVLIDPACGTPSIRPLRYYIDPAEMPHLSHWMYSPAGARKVVETDFKACE